MPVTWREETACDETKPMALVGGELGRVPREVAGYRVEEPLGSGSMGSVFAARGPSGERVALKIVRIQSFVGRQRFRRNIEVQAELRHPAIPPLLAHGLNREFGYLATPLLNPRSLGDELRLRTLSFDAAADALAPVASALAELHERDWVHRDVKPANVLRDAEGQAFLVDYGLAKRHRVRLEDSGYLPVDDEDTQPNAICGTPLYMSGQRLQAEPALPSDDCFAFALSLIKALSGKVPGEDSARTFLQLAEQRVGHRLSVGPLPCPAAIRKALQAALAPRGEARPSMGDFAALLS